MITTISKITLNGRTPTPTSQDKQEIVELQIWTHWNWSSKGWAQKPNTR